ncbi:hypothetical protein L207DRAFT_552432 [Hyaloscypha variabilis F]|uniref:MHYT domain-containing protein n=1 Tax=Hyaloscypha variabilis (strain UAMH 11265 / GT02V1 / F) TaxID=1149755 RepID=A0A2J6RZU9_HYAVF|nr:hypothetical protein L207DRAFT_552432 [Hyaloscypha variabilis F]
MSNATNTSTVIPLQRYAELKGQIISRSFIPGYVVSSYFVSFLGAWTALELISRRTAIRGRYNWFLLAGSSFSMGGIAIWSMYYIGNRAIILDDDQPELQIVYSNGYTVISFFMPVAVLFLVFAAVGSNATINNTRVVLGGALTGFTICGMHYLGQAGIANYDCVYPVSFVVGAILIAVAASIVSLCIFFLFHLTWDTKWWKRPICASVLASAVSGMHWLASVGTQYRLKYLDPSLAKIVSRILPVIVALVLSLCCCIVLLLTMLSAQWRLAKLAKRAHQVVLTAAIFDYEERILVSPEGFLPHKTITDAWVERSLDDVFSVSHPVFLWMFRTSRNWTSVVKLLPAMRNHVHRVGLQRWVGSKFEGNLLKESGSPIEDYSLVFRELFCLAAGELARDLHEPLDQIGVLYDEITITGQQEVNKKGRKKYSPDADLEGLSGSGKGQILFLVRLVNRHAAEHLQHAGFLFAEPANVVPLLAATLHVGPKQLTHRIDALRYYAAGDRMLKPGVHVAIFAIRASLGAGRHGFDVLARKDAQNQLPTMQFPFDALEDWKLEYLKTMDGMTMAQVGKKLVAALRLNPSARERQLAKHIFDTIEAIKEEGDDPVFSDSKLIATPIQAPCRGVTEDSPPGFATLITFRLILPVHSRAPGQKLMFIPLNFFKMQQQVYKNSPDHDIFARKTHREFAPMLDLEDSQPERWNEVEAGKAGSRRNAVAFKQRRYSRIMVEKSSEATLVDVKFHDGGQALVDGKYAGAKPEATCRQISSTSPRTLGNSEKPAQVDSKQHGAGAKVKEGEEKQTYIDEMFTIAIAKR